MFRKLAASSIAVASLFCLWGCEELAMNSDIAKLIPATRLLQSDNATMSQIQQRDRLQDGTGSQCLVGTTNTPGGSGNGQGTGDPSRLRDGTCLQ